MAKTWEDLPLVEVVWMDAAADLSHEGTLDDKESIKSFGGAAECRDVGYLVRQTPKYLYLAMGVVCDDGGFRHSNTLPKSIVTDVIDLRRGESIKEKILKRTRKPRIAGDTSTRSTS